MYINRSTRREFLESLRNENSEVRIMPIFRREKWNLLHFSFWWICRVEISLDRQLWSEEFLCIFEVSSMNWLRRWTWRWLIVWCVSGCSFPKRFQSILLLLETNSNIRQRNISKTSKVKRKVFELTFEEKKNNFLANILCNAANVIVNNEEHTQLTLTRWHCYDRMVLPWLLPYLH